MSIKGAMQELYVGKNESSIMHFFGRKDKIIYSELSCISYAFVKIGVGGGYLDFKYKDGKRKRFDFGYGVNEKIQKTVELIQENNPELEIIEDDVNDYKFYQKDWFITFLLFICCMPLGLFLIWYYKKYDKLARIMLTIFFITIYGIGIFMSIPRTYNYHITLDEYNRCESSMTYQECINIIGGKGESTAEVNIMDINTSTYVWYGDDSKMKIATMYFTNDKLISKAQFGLE